LITQQVGIRNDVELNAMLGVLPTTDPESHTCERVVTALRSRGCHIVDAREEMAPFACRRTTIASSSRH
jgi:hypothetical protein